MYIPHSGFCIDRIVDLVSCQLFRLDQRGGAPDNAHISIPWLTGLGME